MSNTIQATAPAQSNAPSAKSDIDLAKVRADADADANARANAWARDNPDATQEQVEAQRAKDLKMYGAENPLAREAAWVRANSGASPAALEAYRVADRNDSTGKVEVNIVSPFLFVHPSGESTMVKAGRQFMTQEMADHWFVKHHSDDPPEFLYQPGTPAYADEQRRKVARKHLLDAAVAQAAEEGRLKGKAAAQPAKEAAEAEAAEETEARRAEITHKTRPVGRKAG